MEDALSVGFRSTYAVPMRLRDQVIGALNLFLTSREPLTTSQLQMARVMTDIAAIGIINHWTLQRQEVLAQQLQSALNSRVIIEQAKGVIAERGGISMGEAFDRLRSTARSSQRPMAEVVRSVIESRGRNLPPTPR